LLHEEIDPQRTQQQEQVGDDEELVSDRHVQKRHALGAPDSGRAGGSARTRGIERFSRGYF
jgi:hypothetical protein